METSKKNLINLWKEDVKWNKLSKEEKKNVVLYAVSSMIFLATITTWFALPSLISAAYYFNKIKNLNIEE